MPPGPERDSTVPSGLSPEGDTDAGPLRIFDLYPDEPPAPAVYAELAPEDGDAIYPVIVHNLRYYELAMKRWDVGFIELLVLNELHELTHWAMTDAERERFDRKSRMARLPDGSWFNPILLDIIEWLPENHRSVVEDRPNLWERIRRSLMDRMGIEREDGDADGTETEDADR